MLVIIATGVYTVIDNGRVVVRAQRVLVSNLPETLEGYTILHISDLNGKRFGPEQKQLSTSLKNRRYNAVCVTGDMVGAKGDPYPFYDLLTALDPTRPVFFIGGDSDPPAINGAAAGSNAVLAEWVLGAQSRNAIFLGAPASLTVGGETIWFTDASQLSLDLDMALNAYATSNTAVSQYYAEVLTKTQAARKQMRETDLHISLTHKPVSAEMIQTMQSAPSQDERGFVRTVDLILAGGTVGGQWRLPLIGPVWADRWFPGDNYVKGYHHAGSLLQYISAGLGTSATTPLPDFRLLNTPEVTLITFTSRMEGDVLP